MDEASGQTLLEPFSAPDAVLGSSNLVETADPTRISSARYGGGLRFQGGTAEGDIATWASGLTTHDFTVEMWVKSVDNGFFDTLLNAGRFRITSYAVAGQVEYQLGVKGDDNVMYGIDGANVATGVWHHIVGTFTGTTAAIYIDGVPGQTATISIAAPFAVGTVTFGGDPANSPVDADIDDVFVGTQAFTLADVQARYCPAP